MTPISTPGDVIVITGEPSGEAYGVALVEALRQLVPDVRVAGMGTRPMASAGIDLLEDAGAWQLGFLPVLARLPEFIRLDNLGGGDRRASAEGRADN